MAVGNDDDGAFRLMSLPALALLGFMLEVFAVKEASISRERELAADRAAAEAAPESSFVAALTKVAAYAPLWGHCQEVNHRRLSAGLVTKNLSLAFADTVRLDVIDEKVVARINDILQTRIAHPADSHPPLSERFEALLGFIRDISTAVFSMPDRSGAGWFDDLDKLETELTLREHKFALAAGLCRFPAEDQQTQDQKVTQALLRATYALGAAVLKDARTVCGGKRGNADALTRIRQHRLSGVLPLSARHA